MASQPNNRHAFRKGLIIAGVVAAGAIGWSALKPKPSPPPVASQPKQVTALGRLTPEGSLVPLAVPAGTAGGNEVVERWLAGEGDTITKGQVLVRLSSYDELQSALVQAESKLQSTGALLPFLKVSQNRGEGAFPGWRHFRGRTGKNNRQHPGTTSGRRSRESLCRASTQSTGVG